MPTAGAIRARIVEMKVAAANNARSWISARDTVCPPLW